MSHTPHRWMLRSFGVLLPFLLLPMLAIAEGGAGAVGEISGRITDPAARLRENVVVYLEHVDGTFPPPTEPAVVDQRGLHFHPSVLPILLGTEVEFLNHDSVNHNVYSPDHESYNLGVWSRGEQRSQRFDHLGVYRQLCHLHPNMLMTILVLQNPYFSVSSADGRFRIQHVPEGAYVLKFWSKITGETERTLHVRADRPTRVSLRLHPGSP